MIVIREGCFGEKKVIMVSREMRREEATLNDTSSECPHDMYERALMQYSRTFFDVSLGPWVTNRS